MFKTQAGEKSAQSRIHSAEKFENRLLRPTIYSPSAQQRGVGTCLRTADHEHPKTHARSEAKRTRKACEGSCEATFGPPQICPSRPIIS
jgi:hypothetical protein